MVLGTAEFSFHCPAISFPACQCHHLGLRVRITRVQYAAIRQAVVVLRPMLHCYMCFSEASLCLCSFMLSFFHNRFLRGLAMTCPPMWAGLLCSLSVRFVLSADCHIVVSSTRCASLHIQGPSRTYVRFPPHCFCSPFLIVHVSAFIVPSMLYCQCSCVVMLLFPCIATDLDMCTCIWGFVPSMFSCRGCVPPFLARLEDDSERTFSESSSHHWLNLRFSGLSSFKFWACLARSETPLYRSCPA